MHICDGLGPVPQKRKSVFESLQKRQSPHKLSTALGVDGISVMCEIDRVESLSSVAAGIMATGVVALRIILSKFWTTVVVSVGVEATGVVDIVASKSTSQNINGPSNTSFFNFFNFKSGSN